MSHFKSILFICLAAVSSCNLSGQENRTKQTQLIGGPCEGCEAVFEYGSKKLTAIDTLPHFEQTEPKLKLTGTVFERDGRTPAENVIIYIYQTNRAGLYVSQINAKGWGRRHGAIRGWVKTDKAGQYTFYTFRPAAYPTGSETEHIHLTIKEPNRKEYYMDEFVFDDDPLLTSKERNKLENRGGSGIVKPIKEDQIFTARRDIILGLNIPNYE